MGNREERDRIILIKRIQFYHGRYRHFLGVGNKTQAVACLAAADELAGKLGWGDSKSALAIFAGLES